MSNSAARRLLDPQRGQLAAVRTGNFGKAALTRCRQDGAAHELEDEVVAHDRHDQERDERNDAVKFAANMKISRLVSLEAGLGHDGQREAVQNVERGDEPDNAAIF